MTERSRSKVLKKIKKKKTLKNKIEFDLAIKNGKVYTAKGFTYKNIGILNGKIETLSTTSISAKRTIDASRKLVLPGIIDVHTHFNLKQGLNKTIDDFHSGSIACIAGGVTTFIDYITPEPDESVLSACSKRITEAKATSLIDFSFHLCLINFNKESEKQLNRIFEMGISSFKMYLAYRDKGWWSNDGQILRALNAIRDRGGILEVHCENDYLIEYFLEVLKKQNKYDYRYAYESRPDFVEGMAIDKVLYLNKIARGNLYIVHLSTALGYESIKKVKDSMNIFIETCPHFLALTKDKLKNKNGYLFTTCPPLREGKDIEALWKGIKSGLVDTVATDHCAFSAKIKERYKNNLYKMAYGIPGVEYLFRILYNEGHIRRKIPLEDLLKLVTINPARIFKLKGKGEIKEGSDADILVFDPSPNYKLTYREHFHPVDYNPYEGMKIKGKIDKTIVKGKLVFECGNMLKYDIRGQLLKRL